jgi:hypothetical protein
MFMTGLFRFALLPGVEASAFEEHMTDEVFTHPNALQLTRITRGFSHQLLAATLRRPGDPELINPHPGLQYVWQATVDLQTDSVQERVAEFATLIAIESYFNVEA